VVANPIAIIQYGHYRVSFPELHIPFTALPQLNHLPVLVILQELLASCLGSRYDQAGIAVNPV
jgi:hypothetical protein